MPATLLSGTHAPFVVGVSQMAKQAIRTSWLRLLLVPIAIGVTQAPWWWEAVTRWGQRSPLGVVALVPVLAVLAGWWNLRRDPRGRQIHDRQLDLILCLLLTVLAVVLLVLAGGGRNLEAAGASCVAAGAIVVAGWGSRTLWQLRWPIVLLLLTWVEPWAQLNQLLSPLVARLAVGIGQVVSPALVPRPTPTGGWHLASSTNSGLHLDPTASGGVLLMIFIGLACGTAWACGGGGRWRALRALGLGVVLGVVVAATEWLVCVLWASNGSPAPVGAWASGSVHLGTLLIIVVLTVIGAVAQPFSGGRRRTPVSVAQRPAARAVGRLTTAVPQAQRATYAVGAVCAVLTVLTARAASPSTYATVSRAIIGAVEAIWP
jgi:hypothetical protein